MIGKNVARRRNISSIDRKENAMRIMCVVAILLMLFAVPFAIAAEPAVAPEKAATSLEKAEEAALGYVGKAEKLAAKTKETAELIADTAENVEKTGKAIKKIGWLQELTEGDGWPATLARIFLALVTVVIILAAAVKLIFKRPKQDAPK